MQGLHKTVFAKAPATEKIWRDFGRASDCRQGAVSKWLKQAMRGSAFITASSSPIRADDFRQTKKALDSLESSLMVRQMKPNPNQKRLLL